MMKDVKLVRASLHKRHLSIYSGDVEIRRFFIDKKKY